MRALVTGGTGRIGSAIVDVLRSEAWSVLAAGRADGDLADAGAARRLVARAADELGGLDLLVNAAAEGFSPKPVGEVTEADWDAALGATAKGFFVTQAAASHLRDARGLVVMIEDVAAYQPWPSFAPTPPPRLPRRCSPASSRAALRPRYECAGSLPDRLPSSRDGRSGVPPRRYSGRVGSPTDVAEAVLHLVGAEFVTGTRPRRRRRPSPPNRATAAVVDTMEGRCQLPSHFAPACRLLPDSPPSTPWLPNR